MNKALFPGRFDPITLGHLELIERAAKIFDQVVICVLHDEHSMFNVRERMDMVSSCTRHLENVRICDGNGQYPELMREFQCKVIVRGLREGGNFENEFQQSLINANLDADADTVFLAGSAHTSFITSDAVRILLRFGKIPDFLVPSAILPILKNKLS